MLIELKAENQIKIQAANEEFKRAYYEFERFHSDYQWEIDSAYRKAKQIMELNKKMAEKLESQNKKIDRKLLVSEEQLNQKVHYQINIDCYSKKSLGNEVLGRFTFPFAVYGSLGDNNGLDLVKTIE